MIPTGDCQLNTNRLEDTGDNTAVALKMFWWTRQQTLSSLLVSSATETFGHYQVPVV